jgi:hypothetical protein
MPASIANLQAGQWLQLPNTKIRSVLPNPVPQGNPSDLVVAWGGGTVDTARNRMLVWGGGHANYWGNEMYALDLPSLSIKRIVEPSPLTSQANCSSALPDGTPVSRHTYDGLAYIAHADQFFAVNGSMSPCGYLDPATWTYDFAAKKWTLKVANSPSRSFDTLAVYDQATKKVLVKDQSNFFAYSLETNTYTKLNASDMPVDYHLSAAIDSKRRKFVMIGNGVQVIDLGHQHHDHDGDLERPGVRHFAAVPRHRLRPGGRPHRRLARRLERLYPRHGHRRLDPGRRQRRTHRRRLPMGYLRSMGVRPPVRHLRPHQRHRPKRLGLQAEIVLRIGLVSWPRSGPLRAALAGRARVDSKVARLPAGANLDPERRAMSDCRAGGLSAAPARTLVILDPCLAAAGRCCINRAWV